MLREILLAQHYYRKFAIISNETGEPPSNNSQIANNHKSKLPE